MARPLQYIASLRGKDITVIGMGISNRPLIHMLCQAGAHVTARDKNGSLDTTEWTELGIDLHLGEDYLKDISGDFVYRTPGLRPDRLPAS